MAEEVGQNQTIRIFIDQEEQKNREESTIKIENCEQNRQNPKYVRDKSSGKVGKFNQKRWSAEQNIRYAQFLRKNIHLFATDQKKRRSIKINVLIRNAVKTRTSYQCRSHHQKMMKQYKDISSIIKHIETNVKMPFAELTEKRQELDQAQNIDKYFFFNYSLTNVRDLNSMYQEEFDMFSNWNQRFEYEDMSI